MKAYKLLRLSKEHKGKIYPLFVNTDSETVLHKWL